MKKTINVFKNKSRYTASVFQNVKKVLTEFGYEINNQYKSDAVINLVIGGDGTFLKAVHKSAYSKIPFLGINTGHLGFYQEIDPENIEIFAKKLSDGEFFSEELSMLKAQTKNKTVNCLNEIVVKSRKNRIVRLKVYVDGNFVENFSGDGLIISTPHGSTAYNLSCGGAILYPTLKGYQITPIAPVSSSLSRTLKSSVVCPKESVTEIVVSKRDSRHTCFIYDGKELNASDYKLTISVSDKTVKKTVFDKNSYRTNLKEKFL